MPYCAQSDLENALGGPAVLVQLLDKTGSGYADPSIVSSILNRASAEANSAIQVVVDLSSLSVPYPDALIYNTANIASYYAYMEGTQGQAVPDHIKELYTASLDWLDKVALRQRTLGVAVKPATDQDVKQCPQDADPGSARVTRNTLIGLW